MFGIEPEYEYIYILPEERDTILLFIRNSKRGIIRGIGSDVKGRAVLINHTI